MAFDLSTPAAQLAWGVAQRAQEVQDLKAKYEEQARGNVNAQLAPYGNDLSQFDSTFKSIYDPVAKAQQARAKAMQEYVTGLPELLARVKAEKKLASGGGGGGGMPASNLVDYQAIFNWLLGLTTPPQTQNFTGTQTDLGNGMTYGNAGGYGAVYPTASAGPTVKPVTQRPTRGMGWDGKP
jgi:hypothetical protein